MSEKCRNNIKKHYNNNSDNPLNPRHTYDGGKNSQRVSVQNRLFSFRLIWSKLS